METINELTSQDNGIWFGLVHSKVVLKASVGGANKRREAEVHLR
jgi:hypothetical protein